MEGSYFPIVGVNDLGFVLYFIYLILCQLCSTCSDNQFVLLLKAFVELVVDPCTRLFPKRPFSMLIFNEWMPAMLNQSTRGAAAPTALYFLTLGIGAVFLAVFGAI